MQKKKVAVHNLGCKVNSYELDVMVQDLLAAGYEVVPFDEKADVYVINTCTVTNIADRKSRQMLHRAKHQNPDAVVIAVGCYVETDRKEVETDPAIDLAIGNNRKGEIAQILQAYLAGKDSREGKTLGGRTMEDLKKSPSFESMHLTKPGHTRAYIKIQDGCSQFCTYCIIPYARGRIRSRDPEEITEEIKGLAAQGIKEVVITGIHISSYGLEKGKNPEEELLRLLTGIQMIRGIERIRLGSLEPRIMTERFARGIAGLSKVCPQFHLSLQSGCAATLRRMNRHYTPEEYFHSVEILRQVYDMPAITTDVIVGFPGETQEEFEESRAFLEKVGFYEIHVFKYSVRKGTAAQKMPGQVSPQVKAKRSDILLDLTKRQAQEYRREFLGKQEKILLEEKTEIGGQVCMIGHTMRYVGGAVRVQGQDSPLLPGQIVSGTFVREVPGTPFLLLKGEK